jgi:hypothetical protein
MTPLLVPERFEQVMGCTPAELLAWLPRAWPLANLTIDAGHSVCSAMLAGGTLQIIWAPLPPTRIAMLEIPRLKVGFVYIGLSPEQRYQAQKRFDLVTHRGGG